jgi:hypothetical protein
MYVSTIDHLIFRRTGRLEKRVAACQLQLAESLPFKSLRGLLLRGGGNVYSLMNFNSNLTTFTDLDSSILAPSVDLLTGCTRSIVVIPSLLLV